MIARRCRRTSRSWRLADRRRQEQRDGDDDLAVAPLQRADHPHGDQRPQLRARASTAAPRTAETPVRQLAADRRRRHARPLGRHGLDASTTTTSSRNSSSRVWALRRNTAVSPARWSIRSRSRAATAITGLFDVFGTNSGLGSNNVPDDIAEENPNLADPASTTKYADVTTQIGGPIKENKLFFFASAQRFLLETDPSGPVTRRHEVSPRLNLKLTWQPNDQRQLHGTLPVRLRTTSSGARASRR